MAIKFSADVVPFSDLKINPGKLVKRVAQTRRPTLLTSRGRGVAVVQSTDDFEAAEEEWAFMRAVVAGQNDLISGWELSMKQAKARLGL